jgi:hypothetical protein
MISKREKESIAKSRASMTSLKEENAKLKGELEKNAQLLASKTDEGKDLWDKLRQKDTTIKYVV